MRFITQEQVEQIQARLQSLYGGMAPRLMRRLYMMIGRYGVGIETPRHSKYWDEDDCVLITYADTLKRDDQKPLATLRQYARDNLAGRVSVIHLLPFFPSSSDEGFSVIDYRVVREDLGAWSQVAEIGESFDLMFDIVLNHCSRQSEWFRDYVTGIAPARWYFLPMDPGTDLSRVVRPRSHPLLTRTATASGEAWVWTTFSDDQVDLNWRNPDVLFEFLDILLLYLSKGARIFRLDAVAYIWKEADTTCIHRPQAHEIVKLFRNVLDLVAPDAVLLTETNVPHAENISYFGSGDEAHMVYNFTLPPLLLHALLRNDASRLRAWAGTLPDLPAGQAFLNFTASHDGIGVRPLQDILEPVEINWLIKQVMARGGRVSMKSNADGSQSPYELNITYRDALRDSDPELGMARFLCSQAVALAFKGVPAVYIHSLLGTPNDTDGLKRTGQNRSINRKRWDMDKLEKILTDPQSIQGRIHATLLDWLQKRRNHPAFHPDAPQAVLDLGKAMFGFVRGGEATGETIICVYNFSATGQKVPWPQLHGRFAGAGEVRDLLSGRRLSHNPQRNLRLEPYQPVWLRIRHG